MKRFELEVRFPTIKGNKALPDCTMAGFSRDALADVAANAYSFFQRTRLPFTLQVGELNDLCGIKNRVVMESSHVEGVR